ncbi:MAG: hypothetical protein IT371_30380 [Deltaproteobacteria bacterium]|nr:hypothetical protein [Deltaproteobacteria bacterium]
MNCDNIVVLARRPATICLVCRDPLAADEAGRVECDACGAAWHEDCADACQAIGCDGDGVVAEAATAIDSIYSISSAPHGVGIVLVRLAADAPRRRRSAWLADEDRHQAIVAAATQILARRVRSGAPWSEEGAYEALYAALDDADSDDAVRAGREWPSAWARRLDLLDGDAVEAVAGALEVYCPGAYEAQVAVLGDPQFCGSVDVVNVGRDHVLVGDGVEPARLLVAEADWAYEVDKVTTRYRRDCVVGGYGMGGEDDRGNYIDSNDYAVDWGALPLTADLGLCGPLAHRVEEAMKAVDALTPRGLADLAEALDVDIPDALARAGAGRSARTLLDGAPARSRRQARAARRCAEILARA